MFNINGKNLCEHCFAELSPTRKCNCAYDLNCAKYPTSLAEGTILNGRYVVGRVLGKGGFGVTYLCYDSKEEARVAIKEYLPDSLTHRNTGETAVSTYGGESEEYFKAGAQKFYEEAKLVSRFNGNPNIISVYEFFYENNTTYFVMEYLDGTDLKRYIRDNGGRIPEDEAFYIFNKVTEALMVVHSADVLHRDISPDNIFLCRDGRVKLIDFGAARQVIGEASKSLSVILKQGFAPLEQYQKKGKQGPWTDVYALGATIYYSLSGKVIDDAMSRMDDDSLETDGIMPQFADIIKKMLEVKASDRYQTVFELKAALSSIGIIGREFSLKKEDQIQVSYAETSEKIESTSEYTNKINSVTVNTSGSSDIRDSAQNIGNEIKNIWSAVAASAKDSGDKTLKKVKADLKQKKSQIASAIEEKKEANNRKKIRQNIQYQQIPTPPAATGKVSFCMMCGAKLLDNGKFCMECGHKVKED
ncbi:MAG: protein kinase [Clostridia bacterium]|nr:protein kinase [Clostridia bacterium]